MQELRPRLRFGLPIQSQLCKTLVMGLYWLRTILVHLLLFDLAAPAKLLSERAVVIIAADFN